MEISPLPPNFAFASPHQLTILTILIILTILTDRFSKSLSLNTLLNLSPLFQITNDLPTIITTIHLPYLSRQKYFITTIPFTYSFLFPFGSDFSDWHGHIITKSDARGKGPAPDQGHSIVGDRVYGKVAGGGEMGSTRESSIPLLLVSLPSFSLSS